MYSLTCLRYPTWTISLNNIFINWLIITVRVISCIFICALSTNDSSYNNHAYINIDSGLNCRTPYNNYAASNSMFLQEGINLFLCGQQNSVCLFHVDKVIVNIDVLISHVMGERKGERKRRGFCWQRRVALKVWCVFGCDQVPSEPNKGCGKLLGHRGAWVMGRSVLCSLSATAGGSG